MSTPGETAGEPTSEATDPGEAGRPAAESDWQRRRRLAEVFGDVLPDTTSDEREPGDPSSGRGDDWLKEQVPPHHG